MFLWCCLPWKACGRRVTTCMQYQRNYIFQQTADFKLPAKHFTTLLRTFFYLFTSVNWCKHRPIRFSCIIHAKDFAQTYLLIKWQKMECHWSIKSIKCKPMCVFQWHRVMVEVGVVKCAFIRDDTSPSLTPSPSEADTCTPSSVGFIVRLWLRHVSLVHCWRDQAANRALHPISGYQCSSVVHRRQGLSMWDTPSGSHLDTQLTPTGSLF